MLGADTVVQVAGQDAFLHDIGLLSGDTFVVDVDRTAVERNRTVVHHIDMLVTNLLVQLVGEDRRILAIEVGFESMADCFVQQDTGASGTHYDRHFASFRLDGLEQDGSFFYCLLCYFGNDIVCQEFSPHTESAGCIRIFDLPVVFHDADRT